MKGYAQILSAAFATMLLASCGSSKQASIAELNGEWEITSIEGNAVKAETTPYIGINASNGSVYGNAGCNQITGSINKNQKPGTIDFSQLGSTRMMCADMAAERTVMDMLNRAKGYKIDKSTLLLTDAGGRTIAQLQNRKGKLAHADLQGEWTIVSVDGMGSEEAEEKPTIWFDTEEHLTHGNAGCNSFDGSYTTGGNQTIKFGNLALTMRLCGNMDFEDKLTKTIDDVASFGKLPNGNVGMFGAAGEMLIELAR